MKLDWTRQCVQVEKKLTFDSRVHIENELQHAQIKFQVSALKWFASELLMCR